MENTGSIELENLYVYVDVIKPGHHFFSVKNQEETYLHRFIARNREEPIPPHQKTTFKLLDHKFVHSNSVFKEWRSDLPDTGERCYENDKKLFKFNRVVKNEKDDINAFVKEHYYEFKEMYDYFKALGG